MKKTCLVGVMPTKGNMQNFVSDFDRMLKDESIETLYEGCNADLPRVVCDDCANGSTTAILYIDTDGETPIAIPQGVCRFFTNLDYRVVFVNVFEFGADSMELGRTSIKIKENIEDFIANGNVVDDRDFFIPVDLEYVKSNVRDGFELNPNEKVVNGVIKGINRNSGLCPCNNDSYDKKCPCSNYREKDHCCCSLYLKK